MHPHFDTTISLGSILVVAGFLLALTKIATRSMIRDELEKHALAQAVEFDKHALAQAKVLETVVSDGKTHAIEDDHRFERITDRLNSAVDSLGEIRDSAKSVQRQEQRINDVDGRLKELVTHVDKRFAEDRQIAHDRYDALQPILNRMAAAEERNAGATEQLQSRMLALETVQRLTPSEQPQ